MSVKDNGPLTKYKISKVIAVPIVKANTKILINLIKLDL